jgi:hypothetical protein
MHTAGHATAAEGSPSVCARPPQPPSWPREQRAAECGETLAMSSAWHGTCMPPSMHSYRTSLTCCLRTASSSRSLSSLLFGSAVLNLTGAADGSLCTGAASGMGTIAGAGSTLEGAAVLGPQLLGGDLLVASVRRALTSTTAC